MALYCVFFHTVFSVYKILVDLIVYFLPKTTFFISPKRKGFSAVTLLFSLINYESFRPSKQIFQPKLIGDNKARGAGTGKLDTFVLRSPRLILAKVSEKSLGNKLLLSKMAVNPSETGLVLHLSDVERNPKELNERGKDATKQPTATSRIEILCKTLAFLIVLCLFCVHLARVLREGKERLTNGSRFIRIFCQANFGCTVT